MSALPAAIGRYEVQAFIARGGMGTLYLAADPVLQRQVAIKLLREADNDELRARFTREARSAANLRHRNIVTIFDVGDHNGQPFMAMEYVQGQTLTSVIESDSPPSIIRRLQLVEDLCDGLAYAHKRGVIHRDVKPANLMLDTEGTLKILDFGIARAAAEAGMTQAGLLVGTLNYMSPEQVAGGELDGRSDMFAVGAVLYELLARRQAFPGSLDGGVLNRILNGEPEPLEALCPHLDPAVYSIVRRALAKAPADRYPDLQQMRNELSHARKTLEASALGDLDETFAVEPQIEPPAAARTPRRGTDREELVRRRTQQIEEYLAAARQALTAGDPDAAIASCEQALVLDPNDGRAFDLAERARVERDERQAQEILGRARESLKKGDLTLASSLVREALSMTPDSTDAIELGRLVGEARLAQERERQRETAVQGLLARARAALERDDLHEAGSATQEALALAPSHVDARKIDDQVKQTVAAREREKRDADAHRTVAEAQALFAAGQQADALALLESFLPAHPVVSQTWTELSAAAARQVEEAEAAMEAALAADARDATLLAPRGVSPAEATVISSRAEPAEPRPSASAAAAPLGAAGAAAVIPASAPARPARAQAGATRPATASRSRTGIFLVAAAVLVLASVGAYFVLNPSTPEVGETVAIGEPVNPPLPLDPLPTPVDPPTPVSPPTNEPAAQVDPTPRAPSPPPPPERPPSAKPEPPSRPTPAQTPPPAVKEPPARTPAPDRQPAPTAAPEATPPAAPTPELPPPPISTTSLPPRADTPTEIRSPQPSRESPPQVSPAPTAPAAPVTSTPPPPAIPDRQQIATAVAQYARGYSARDVATVAAVFPSVDRRALQNSFDGYRELQMDIALDKVDIDGNTAVARTRARQRFRLTAGGQREETITIEFRLQRSGTRWIIESQRFPGQ